MSFYASTFSSSGSENCMVAMATGVLRAKSVHCSKTNSRSGNLTFQHKLIVSLSVWRSEDGNMSNAEDHLRSWLPEWFEREIHLHISNKDVIHSSFESRRACERSHLCSAASELRLQAPVFTELSYSQKWHFFSDRHLEPFILTHLQQLEHTLLILPLLSFKSFYCLPPTVWFSLPSQPHSLPALSSAAIISCLHPCRVRW